ncbi:hypothetical protein [Phormidium sp. CCY1219]|uniref:hypothetical protein n=1 Tax=Phormidium sp. CCY1219 TaxID=2886104 RepID=UPI002D1EB971|nr:hypothetical protein [Phormidium sp. CCY1219]MEB3828501.1 hypothetical protein [Phormidium sp. CCY1219]
MTIVLSFAKIAHYRTELANYPQALEALDAIEDCEGDMEDAAIGLAIQAGQEPNTSERWLEGLAKRCRAALCKAQVREQLNQGKFDAGMEALSEARLCPPKLVAPVIIFVVETGIEEFCEPLDYKIE